MIWNAKLVPMNFDYRLVLLSLVMLYQYPSAYVLIFLGLFWYIRREHEESLQSQFNSKEKKLMSSFQQAEKLAKEKETFHLRELERIKTDIDQYEITKKELENNCRLLADFSKIEITKKELEENYTLLQKEFVLLQNNTIQSLEDVMQQRSLSLDGLIKKRIQAIKNLTVVRKSIYHPKTYEYSEGCPGSYICCGANSNEGCTLSCCNGRVVYERRDAYSTPTFKNFLHQESCPWIQLEEEFRKEYVSIEAYLDTVKRRFRPN